MANKKTFKSPVQIGLRIEKSVRDEIDSLTDNKNEFINMAIQKELNRVKKEVK